MPRVEWSDEPMLLSADELMSGSQNSKSNSAENLITELLKNGPYKAAGMISFLEHAGISERTARSVKKRLGILSQQVRGEYWWCTKDQQHELRHQAQPMLRHETSQLSPDAQKVLDSISRMREAEEVAKKNP